MAMIDGVELTLERLHYFHPLALIAEKHIGQLLEGAALVRLEKGRFLFRKMPRADTAYFLLEGEVFTRDLIETWVELKRKKEVDFVRMRPHPAEFFLYFDA